MIRFLETLFAITMALITVRIYQILSEIESDTSIADVEALAYNIYFEARNSSIEDQIATAVVVLNRGIPSKEVYKPNQFSWTLEYSVPANNKAFRRALAVAEMVYDNPEIWQSKDICKHYTTAQEYPKGHWTHSFKRRTQIGKHYYYCD